MTGQGQLELDAPARSLRDLREGLSSAAPGRLRISERTLEDLAGHHAAFKGTVDLSDPDQARAWVAIMRSFDALLEAARAGVRAEVAVHGPARRPFTPYA